jgi:tetrapyrrole methylase family protein/MazG family protein
MTASSKDQADITIIGLGPGDPELITVKALNIIQDVGEIYLRTREHPSIAGLPKGIKIHSFDEIYDQASDYQEVYQQIADEIITLAQSSSPLIYAVPGDPMIAEETPNLILAQARKQGLSVEIVPGVSFIEPVYAALEQDPLPQTTIIDALELREVYFPPFPPDQPALLVQLYSREIASDIKLILMALYPDQHPVQLIHNAGTELQLIEEIALFEIDRSDQIGDRTALYLPALGDGTSLESFQNLIAHLRSPEGCPWDREQDHQSLRTNLLEECYEVLEAIDADDPEAMREEFGDLLLQVILHTQIAAEYGQFTMSEVIRGIYRKLIKRHPHVFEDLSLEQPEAVIQNWERIKADERKKSDNQEQGILDGVPVYLPALSQAYTFQKRAARVGFDWESMEGVLEKLPEEIDELKGADELTQKTQEMGDLIFTLVNIARWLEIDPESALRGANQRFKSRFHYLEREARAQKRELEKMTMEELDQLWEQSKLALDD